MTNRICTVEDCGRKRGDSRLYCPMHYTRWSRYGDPGGAEPRTNAPTATLAERLEHHGWDEVIRRPDLGPCWEWKGSRLKSGYGRCPVGKQKTVVAHRVSYEAYVGPVPDGGLALHHCDNPPCINPAHIFIGDHMDNRMDMVSKERDLRGSRSPHAKLTFEDASAIRLAYAAGGVSQMSLAARFNVQQTTISRVVRGVSY